MSRYRGTLAALAALVTTALIAGCASSDPEEQASGDASPVTGGTLVYLEHQAHDSLYPPAGGFYPNGGILNNLADRLVYQDRETLEFEPWLAREWTVNDDATEYTFTIRDDVTFSDGTALTPEIVAANFDLYGLGDADRGLVVSEAINNYESSEVLDDDRVRFTFSAPSPGFLQATSTINSGILAPSSLELDLEGFGPGNSEAVIATGPFTVGAEVIGTSFELNAREDYAWAPESWENDGRPYVDTVSIQVTPEDSVRVGALLAGQADIVRYVQAQDEAQLAGEAFEIHAPQTNGINNSLNLRFRNEILADADVRHAIASGVNREEVVDTIYTDNYPLATSVLSSTAPGYIDLSDRLSYDQDRANQLLDDAGWVRGEDGIREKDGEPLHLVVNEAAPQPRSFEAVTLISQQLREIGIDLEVLRADAGSFAEAILDKDRVPVYHSMVARTDLDVIKSQFASDNRNNLLNRDPADDSIGDKRLEELLAAVASEADPEERTGISQEIQRYLLDEAYVIPLFEEPQVYGSRSEVHGFGFETVARPSFAQTWIEQ